MNNPRLFEAPPAERQQPWAELEGSPKQIAWAEDIRAKLLPKVETLVRDLERLVRTYRERGDAERAEKANARLARAQSVSYRLATQASAKWWIENREKTAEELVDQVRL